MKFNRYSILLIIGFLWACAEQEIEYSSTEICQLTDGKLQVGRGALLASRIGDLQEFKSLVRVEYLNGLVPTDSADEAIDRVQIEQCTNGKKVISTLESGLSQEDISAAKNGSVWKKLGLLIRSPYTIIHRTELQYINILARRRYDLFGATDVAFYDLAEQSVKKIKIKQLAYLNPRDSSEKGYINSFNHVTAQALITSIYNKEIADFIADVHERHNMPEIIHGRFSETQLNDPNNNPVDNYVDMLNNEWGQLIGNKLKIKYKLNTKTKWSPELLTTYLNDIQQFYVWTFDIEMKPFRTEEDVIQLFSNKLNVVLSGEFDD